jgi:hypothetical protein
MTIVNVPILLILFIFAIVTHAWIDPDKSMNTAANGITTMKMNENRHVVLEMNVSPSYEKGPGLIIPF